MYTYLSTIILVEPLGIEPNPLALQASVQTTYTRVPLVLLVGFEPTQSYFWGKHVYQFHHKSIFIWGERPDLHWLLQWFTVIGLDYFAFIHHNLHHLEQQDRFDGLSHRFRVPRRFCDVALHVRCIFGTRRGNWTPDLCLIKTPL